MNEANQEKGTAEFDNKIELFDNLIQRSGKKFQDLSVAERSAVIERAFGIKNTAYNSDADNLSTLTNLSENVIGILDSPLSLITAQINGKDRGILMSLEEPSVVAGAAWGAKTARRSGGFKAWGAEPILRVQIHLYDVEDVESAVNKMLSNKAKLIEKANNPDAEIFPNAKTRESIVSMVERGGGIRDFEIKTFNDAEINEEMLKRADELKLDVNKMMIIELKIDVRNAMGANFVNTVGDMVGDNLDPLIANITSGKIEEYVFGKRLMTIISNKCEERIAYATAEFSFNDLKKTFKDDQGALVEIDGKTVAEKIVHATIMANLDESRAVTHNKGIMNGIISIVNATGNDTRAVESGASVHAIEKSRKTLKTPRILPLTDWKIDYKNEKLIGTIDIPIAVGTVGRANANPTTKFALDLLKSTGIETSQQLAQAMACIGLVQNLAALRSLVTNGINPNHMPFHNRGKFDSK